MRDLDSARKTLRIAGILSIVLGAIALIIALLLFVGGGLVAWQFAVPDYLDSNEELPAAAAVALFLLTGSHFAIPSIAFLIQGFLSLRASSDSSEVCAAHISSIAGLAIAAIAIAFFLAFDLSSLAAIVSAVGLALSGALFWASKTCRDRA